MLDKYTMRRKEQFAFRRTFLSEILLLFLLGVASAVRASMEESLVKILSPKKKIDILRDIMESKNKGRPYTIVFCGVNGVGKSTNLAKVRMG